MLMILSLLLCNPYQDTSSRTADWKEDLACFSQQFKAKHVKPFVHISEAEFDEAIQQIQPEKLTDQEIVLKLWQLLARVGDSHSRVNPSNSIRFTQYPIAVIYLTDGWYLFGVDQTHKAHLQGKLVKIGDTPIEEACKKLNVLIAAENPSQIENQLRLMLVMTEALHYVGLVKKKEQASFTFLDKQSKETTITLAPISSKRAEWALAIKPATWPDHLKQNRPPLGFTWLKENTMLYVWYDRCAEYPKYPIATWTKDVVQQINEKHPSKVIVDLRRNGGGNSVLLQPLINQLAKSEVNSKEKLAVLIGPATFSSAMMNAHHFRLGTKAELVGQPTGGCPNHFGEVKTFTLPHSKCVVQYSTKVFQLTKDNAKTIEPHRLITPTATGFFADRDELLEAVLQP